MVKRRNIPHVWRVNFFLVFTRKLQQTQMFENLAGETLT